MEFVKYGILAGLGVATIIGIIVMIILLRQILREIRNTKCLNGKSDMPVAPVVQVVTSAAAIPVAPTADEKDESVLKVPNLEPTEEVVSVDDTVTFSSEKTLTIDDKYSELSNDQKGYYDDIVAYAVKVDGARRFKNARYEEYKVGKNRLVRMLIKRGIIVCEFILPNNDFKNYVNENKLKIKAAPTILKIVDAETVQIAKDSIDIAIKSIEEEKEIKRQQMRERRKQARIAKQG